MLKFDEERVKDILIKEFDFSERLAERFIKILKNLNPELQGPFDSWLRDRSIDDSLSVEGLTLKKIMEKAGCNFIDAMLKMSSFLDDPEEAKKFKSLPKSVFMRK